MRHYVSVPYFELKAAKAIAEKFGDSTQNFSAGPTAWFLKVEENTAIVILTQIPGSVCKTVTLPQPIESVPDAEIILTKRTGTR